MHVLFEPGFFTSGPVHTALSLGALSAVVSAIVGVLTVIRGQSFAGHALTDVATTGGSGSFLISAAPLAGFLGGTLLGAGAMELAGVQRLRGRDVATGVVLGAATGLSALFLYLDTTRSASTGVTQQVLFGSIFFVASSTLVWAAVLTIVTLLAVVVIFRPLLLSSLAPEVAAARGVRVRLVGGVFMATLAVSVGLSSLTVGSVLSTTLLIGPAATALRLTRRMSVAIVLASGVGVLSTWLGVLLAYDSYDWDASGGLPVSFFIVALVLLGYVASGFARRRLARREVG